MYKSFIDTNIWIYAFSESEEDVGKRDKTITFLEKLREKSSIVVSVQVINEFHSALKRKYKIEEEIIREYVSKGIIGIGKVIPLELQTYKDACKMRDKYSISYWDSVIVASALNSQCETLYSEDMQHGHKVAGLEIRNPFAETRAG
jgi:predicted nucleic acid-binding protein